MNVKKQTLGQSGVSAIEFALVLPVLLVILFGIIEFGVLLYDQTMITNASREGARLGITYVSSEDCELTSCHPSEAEIRTRVNEYLGIGDGGSSLLISFESASAVNTNVSQPDGNDNTGQRLRVTVTYDYGWLLLPNFVTSLGIVRTLSATSEMRFE